MTWHYYEKNGEEYRTCEICKNNYIKKEGEWIFVLTRESYERYFENLWNNVSETCDHYDYCHGFHKQMKTPDQPSVKEIFGYDEKK